MKVKRAVMGLSVALLGMLSCASPEGNVKMKFYRGANVPPEFFTLVHVAGGEIAIEARVDFPQSHLYHMILDGDDIVAEAWLPTAKARGAAYRIKLTPKAGLQFELGKTYRLCIGDQNPEAVARFSDNYRCLAEYPFTIPAAWF
jgi:hypothetical protein